MARISGARNPNGAKPTTTTTAETPILAGTLPAFSIRRRDPIDTAALDRQVRIGLFTAGMILSSALARLEGGAWTNALLPAYAAVAVLFGLAAGRLRGGSLLAPIAAILQFPMLVYDPPRTLVPTSRDAAAGRAIVERIRQLPDGVLVLDHVYLAEMAGKRTFAHGWAMTDVLWADQAGAGRALESEVRAAIAARRFPALVLDATPHWFAPDFALHYARADELPDPVAFLPVSGSRRRPDCLPSALIVRAHDLRIDPRHSIRSNYGQSSRTWKPVTWDSSAIYLSGP